MVPATVFRAVGEDDETDAVARLGYFERSSVQTGNESDSPGVTAETGEGLLDQGERERAHLGVAHRAVWVAYGDGTTCIGETSGEVFRLVDDEGARTVSYWSAVQGCPTLPAMIPTVALPEPGPGIEGCRPVPFEPADDDTLAEVRRRDPAFGPAPCLSGACALAERAILAHSEVLQLGLWQSYRVQGLAAFDCNDVRTHEGAHELDAWVTDGSTLRRVSIPSYPDRPVALVDAHGFAFMAGMVGGTWQLFDVAADRHLASSDAQIGPTHPEIHPEFLEPQCGP